ncbi:1-deoxy-D-xylulose-5-phosphate reductoisomerase [candidate division WOR-3 bacterium]|nr:1-deoxy-D-xylulose-5-phosphate reductoisomerase [candidate division WOR-3 bacterium]
MKNVCILGSTGSVGRAALEVIDNLKSEFRVFALSCDKNIQLLKQQVEQFNPKYVCITNPVSAIKFKVGNPDLSGSLFTGLDGLKTLASHPEVDIFLNALVGTIGLHSTLLAIKNKKRVAIANKETLVAYGKIIMHEVNKNGASLLPVDSEHSAIHQCLSQSNAPVRRIILTASGGPFLHKPITADITPESALKHPVWQMGKKITVDSATLMNKGLEVIEASVLFNIPASKIEIVIHPQSIIHSAVEFVDGSIIAQLSSPDMKLPIQYALTYPKRYPSSIKPLDFEKIKKLEFMKPDFNKFPCLRLAYEAAEAGGTMPCVLNSANEVAVQSFLAHEIKLTQISELIEEVMKKHVGATALLRFIKSPSLSEIEQAEEWAQQETKNII